MLDIFTQLGTDQSILYQFILIAVLFVASKFLFLQHLQNVIETREEKTSKLEGNTEKQFADINKLQNDYKQKIHTANKEMKTKLDDGKTTITKKYETQYRGEEKTINEFFEKSKKEIENEIADKKTAVLSDAQDLAKSLVNKIAKG